MENLVGRRVFLTGANGFLGSHLLKALVNGGAEVSVFLRPESDRSRIRGVLPKARVFEGDLLDAAVMHEAARDALPEIFIHAAALGLGPGPGAEAVVSANTVGTLNAVNAAAAAGVKSFVYLGTCMEYGAGVALREDAPLNPASLYGASKAAGHLVARAAAGAMPVVTVRPFTVYGPADRDTHLVPDAMLSALKEGLVRLKGGAQERDLLFVDDAVDGVLRAALRPDLPGGVVNLASGTGLAVAEIAKRAVAALGLGRPVPIETLPGRPAEIMRQSGDWSLAKKELGWSPRTGLEEGLARTAAWYASSLKARAS